MLGQRATKCCNLIKGKKVGASVSTTIDLKKNRLENHNKSLMGCSQSQQEYKMLRNKIQEYTIDQQKSYANHLKLGL